MQRHKILVGVLLCQCGMQECTLWVQWPSCWVNTWKFPPSPNGEGQGVRTGSGKVKKMVRLCYRITVKRSFFLRYLRVTATTETVRSTIWARTPTSGRLPRTVARTHGTGTWTRVTVSRTGTTTIRRTALAVGASRTDLTKLPSVTIHEGSFFICIYIYCSQIYLTDENLLQSDLSDWWK